MKYTCVSRGFFLILLACIAQSCLDNNCENASSTTQTVKFSENNPGDITKFKWENNRKISYTVDLENVCLLSLIDVEVYMVTKEPHDTQERPTAMIHIDGEFPSAIYNKSIKSYKDTQLHTYSCSSVAKSDKSTVTISIFITDNWFTLELSLIQSLWVDINYYQLPGGSNP